MLKKWQNESAAERQRGRISVTIWKADQEIAIVFSSVSLFCFLSPSVRLSNVCHYLTVIWTAYMLWNPFCATLQIQRHATNLAFLAGLTLLHLCAFYSPPSKNIKPQKSHLSVKINVNRKTWDSRSLGLIVSLTTVSQQPLLLNAFL